MSQPIWKFVANLGDKHPLEYGGLFVYEDTTGVYPPEAELLELQDESDDPHYLAYRFVLDECFWTNVQGVMVLSDNKFHKDKPAWFAKPEIERAARPQDTTYLKSLADTFGLEVEDLVKMFTSPNSVERACGWRLVGEYHGMRNLDDYPLELRKREARKRYLEKNGEKY